MPAGASPGRGRLSSAAAQLAALRELPPGAPKAESAGEEVLHAVAEMRGGEEGRVETFCLENEIISKGIKVYKWCFESFFWCVCLDHRALSSSGGLF